MKGTEKQIKWVSDIISRLETAKQEFKESIAAHGEKSLWNESHLITAQKRIDWINSQEFASKAIQMASEANWDEIGLEYED